jgi:hypothetical protein
MDEGSYFNFDLILERVGEKYRARVFDSPAGQASAEFKLPFSELELENFVLRMGRPRSGVRRVDSTEMEAVKGCGERLFRAVFTDDVYACFLRSRDAALEEEKGLRVRLHIDVPEFHDYPWEFLYNAHLNQFLALSKDTPVVRYLELPYPVQPLTVQPPLKILVMISSQEGFPPLNVEEEWKRLSNALAPLIRRGLVNLDRLKDPTLSALQQHLRRGEYHIFHFIGHGKFSEHKQDGMLLLEEENGKGRPVSGQYLGTVLHDHHSLRLVVLNACEGARTSQEDPYAGVAQTLVLQGIPAVIAMQFEILETAAITFAQEFYGAVADGFPVDAAVSEARKAIFARGNDVEWGTPVLYMRTPQGVIFEIPEAQQVRQPLADDPISYVDKELEQKLEGLYTEGLAAFWVEDWDKACDRFQRILADRPDHAAAADKLAEAKRQQNLSMLYSQAMEAQSAENWTLALRALEQLLKDAPEYKNAATMLKGVKKKKQLAELYAEAKQLHAAKKWQAVAKVFTQITSIDPNYPDIDNLLPTAEKELEELKRLAELNELYSRAVHAMDAGHWEEAQRLLTQVQAMEPGFLETEKLLSKVESEIRKSKEEQERRDQINTLYEQAHGLLRSKKWRQALEKIEVIRKLDEQFEDTEIIGEQAQVELVHEEQEAEHQNELAAMYAEAVRLAREEKYQEALEKWQEIKGIDPKYPDRQKVQRTARKSLAALAKPVTKKPRITISKSLWIGLGGIVTIVVIILVLVLSGKNGEEPSSLAILVPTSSSEEKVVVSTSTKTPVKTSATSRPTATQGTSGYSDPTMYDDFSGSKIGTNLWDADQGMINVSIQNGYMRLKKNVLGAKRKAEVLINEPYFVESRFQTARGGGLVVYAWFENGQALCQTYEVSSKMHLFCKVFIGDKENVVSDQVVSQEDWNRIRIEIQPSPLKFTFYVNGAYTGNYETNMRNSRISFGLGSWCTDTDCYFDYVRIGAIADDPTLVDNFENASYDGRFDTGRWTYDQHDGDDSIVQQDGVLVLTQGGINKGQTLKAVKYSPFKLQYSVAIEANLKADLTNDGFITLNLNGENMQASCGLHSMSDFVIAHCWNRSMSPDSAIGVGHGTWHTVRMEVNLDTNTITFFIDGKQLTDDHYERPLLGTDIYLDIRAYVLKDRLKNTRPMLGYVDNVRVIPLEYVNP